MRHYIIPAVLAVSLLLCTGCSGTPQEMDSLADSTTQTQTTPSQTTADISPEATTLSSETAPLTDAAILTAICREDAADAELAAELAEYMQEKADTLPAYERLTDVTEATLIARAREVLLDAGAADAVAYAESPTVELDGEQVPYERDGPCWRTTYYAAYDAWHVMPALPSGVTADGRRVAAPGEPPYVILAGTDGRVLGVFY